MEKAAGMLELTTGIKGGSFQRARVELQERGFITVTKRSGNQAALYQMISQIQVFDDNGCFVDDRQHKVEQPIGDTKTGAGAFAKIAQGEVLSWSETIPQEEKGCDVPNPDVEDRGEARTDTTKSADLAAKQCEAAARWSGGVSPNDGQAAFL